MKSRIVQISNSRGIRLPKVLLEEAQLADEVELVLAARIQPIGDSNEEYINSIQLPHACARASDICGDHRELRY